MTDRPGRDDLRVRADLTLSVDGVPARLTGDGDLLTLDTGSVRGLWALARGGDRRALGPVADALAGSGVRLEVRTPYAVVARLGRGIHSRTGHLATGSHAVSAGPAVPLAVRALSAAVVVLLLVRRVRRRG